MIYIILMITITYINCFENIKYYSISNNLHKLFGENSKDMTRENSKDMTRENSKDMTRENSKEDMTSKNRSFYEPKYSDNLFLSYHKWINPNINKENKPSDDELLQEELKQIYKNNFKIFKNMQKHNKKRNNKY